MKPERDIRQLFRKAAADADAGTDAKVLAKVLATHEAVNPHDSAVYRSSIRSTIMRSPIAKIAIAAAVVVAVLIGISQLGGSPAGVAWGEVARKIEASRGVTLRCTETTSFLPGDGNHSIKYLDPTHSRTDTYKDGRIVKTFYNNFETMTLTAVFHTHKHYISGPIDGRGEGFLENQEDWTNPRYLVQTILSGKHRELGQKTIDDVKCEGIETTDPNVMGPMPGPVTRLEVEMRLWIDAKTQYPVRFEAKIDGEAEGKSISSECVMDQFRWDVDLNPSLFEPNIPSGYLDISP
ncbi:MAG: hypothetical protein ACM3VT_17560 [Solirubrobacterales bacterium]